jgi:hypothetical protein
MVFGCQPQWAAGPAKPAPADVTVYLDSRYAARTDGLVRFVFDFVVRRLHAHRAA